jgi:hypothetical protein
MLEEVADDRTEADLYRLGSANDGSFPDEEWQQWCNAISITYFQQIALTKCHPFETFLRCWMFPLNKLSLGDNRP